MNRKEQILIEILKANRLEVLVSYLQYYIKRNGFPSDEAWLIIKKLVEEKQNE